MKRGRFGCGRSGAEYSVVMHMLWFHASFFRCLRQLDICFTLLLSWVKCSMFSSPRLSLSSIPNHHSAFVFSYLILGFQHDDRDCGMARIHEVTWEFRLATCREIRSGPVERISGGWNESNQQHKQYGSAKFKFDRFYRVRAIIAIQRDGWRIAVELADCENAIAVTRRKDTISSLGYTSPITSTAPLYIWILQCARKNFSSQQPFFILSAIPTSSSTFSSSEDIILLAIWVF